MTTTSMTGSPPEVTRPAPQRGPLLLGGSWLTTGVVATTFAVVAALVATTDGFFAIGNLKLILLASAVIGIIALGQTLIMISGSFVSLSLGTTMAISAMTFLWALQWGIVVAMVITVASAAVQSGLQGFAIGAWGANPVIVTIGMSAVLQAAAVWRSDGATIVAPPDAPSVDFLANPVGGVGIAFYAFLALAILLHLVLTRTRLGNRIFLVGSSPRAAVAAGLPVATVVTCTFLLAGAMAGVAGILVGSSQHAASLSVEGTVVFDAIAATLLGVTAVTGGSGSALRTAAGAIVMAALSSALALRGYSPGVQLAARGALLILAMLLCYRAGNLVLSRAARP